MSTFNNTKWQNLAFAVFPGNFKGKTVTLKQVTVYSGTSSTDVTSNSSISAKNDYDFVVQSSGDVAGKMTWVKVDIS